MQVFRNIVNKLSLFALIFLIVFGTPFFIFLHSLENKETVKEWLVDAEVYPLVTKQIYEAARQEAVKSQKSVETIKNNSFFDENKIFQSVSTVLDETFMQEQVEGVLDGVYAWLEGKTEVPQYTISLKEKWPETARAIEAELKQQYQALPVCEVGQSLPKQTDISKITCQVPGRSVDKQITAFVQSFEAQKNQIATGEWSGSAIVASDANQGGLQQADLKRAQTAYSVIAVLPIVAIVIAVILSLIFLFTAVTKRSGFKVLAVTFVVSAILLSLYALVLSQLDIVGFFYNAERASDSVADTSKTVIASLLETAFATVSSKSYQIAAGFAGLGLSIAAIMWLLDRRGLHTHQVENPNPTLAPQTQTPPPVTPQATTTVPGEIPNIPAPTAPQPKPETKPQSVEGVAAKPRRKIQ